MTWSYWKFVQEPTLEGTVQWLDRAPRGRNERMFVGAGDLRASVWYRRHDEYGSR